MSDIEQLLYGYLGNYCGVEINYLSSFDITINFQLKGRQLTIKVQMNYIDVKLLTDNELQRTVYCRHFEEKPDWIKEFISDCYTELNRQTHHYIIKELKWIEGIGGPKLQTSKVRKTNTGTKSSEKEAEH
jgi:hypothetical protein